MESVIDNLKQIVKCTSGLVYCPSILIDAAIREIERLRAERDALEDGLLCVYDNLSDPPISDDLAMAMCWRIEARFPRLFNKERVVSND